MLGEAVATTSKDIIDDFESDSPGGIDSESDHESISGKMNLYLYLRIF